MVAVPFHVKQVERGDSVVYGVGIMNPGGVSDSGKYYVTVEAREYVDSEGNAPQLDAGVVSSLNSWLLFNSEAISIDEGEFVKELLLVEIPKDAKTGQYIFNLKVCTTANCEDGTRHGNPQKFTVVVS